MNATKQCTMNCGLATGDPRTRAEMMLNCEDCHTLSPYELDLLAVKQFGTAMMAKLNKKRAEGRSGWQTATAEDLSKQLIEHIAKGDPVDVANFCMMIHQNGRSILAPSQNQLEEQLAMALTTIERMVTQ